MVSPLAIGIGGFVSDRVALFGRASAMFFRYSPQAERSEDSRLQSRLTHSVFLGATAKWWLTDKLTLESGLGFSFLGNGPVEAQLDRAIGVPGRVGWSLGERDSGSLSAVLEVLPSFFSRGETTLSSSVGIQWQWL